MNQDAIQARRKLCPDYIRKEGRNDPFVEENLIRLVQSRSESYLLKRKILSFDDALDHADAIVTAWAAEDRELEEIAARKVAVVTPVTPQNVLPELPPIPAMVFPEGNAKQQVEFARIQWKEAVQWRRDMDERMKTYVGSTLELYKALRGV